MATGIPHGWMGFKGYLAAILAAIDGYWRLYISGHVIVGLPRVVILLLEYSLTITLLLNEYSFLQ